MRPFQMYGESGKINRARLCGGRQTRSVYLQDYVRWAGISEKTRESFCLKDKEALCTNKSTNVEFAGGLQPANLQEVSQPCPAETLLA